VESLARQVGVDASTEQAEQIRWSIGSSLDGYESLAEDMEIWAPTADQDVTVTVNPGANTDPHNAFTSTFRVDGGTGQLGDLAVAVKDNISVGGEPMSCGLGVFADAVPASDAVVVTLLLAAGATLTGKANMDELAYGPTGETNAFGTVGNPAAPGRVSGGSSAGSAAAGAGGHVDAALGTDTGGSVRIPASFCDIVGFKPTWGMVPTDGVLELSYTLDYVGTLARDIQTVARLASTIADDPTTADLVADRVFDTAVTDSLYHSSEVRATDQREFIVPEPLPSKSITGVNICSLYRYSHLFASRLEQFDLLYFDDIWCPELVVPCSAH